MENVPSELKNMILQGGHISFSDIYKFYGSYFNSLEDIFTFCRENSIILNISLEDVELLKSIRPQDKGWYKDGKVSSLDGIALIRRCFDVPIGGKCVPTINGYTEEKEEYAIINGEKRRFPIKYSQGYPTVHWMMNQEVLPHVTAPDGWYDRTITIIQPLTESLYDEAAGLDPVDTYFTGPMALDKAIIICKNPFDAEQARQENPNATIILFPDMLEYREGIGNVIVGHLGYGKFYMTYAGARLDGEKNLVTDLYTDDLMKSHSKLITSKRPVGTKEHDIGDSIYKFSGQYEITKHIIDNTDIEYISNHTFDELLNMLRSNETSIGTLSFYMGINIFDPQLESLLNMYPDKYSKEVEFFKKLYTMHTFDANQVFSMVTEGIPIDENNEEVMTRIKEIIIKQIEECNKKLNYLNLGEWGKSEYNLAHAEAASLFFLLKMVCNSPYMKAKVDKSIVYDLPLKYCDFSYILNQGGLDNQDLASTMQRLFLSSKEAARKSISSIKISPYTYNPDVSNMIELIDSVGRDKSAIEKLALQIMDQYGCQNQELYEQLEGFIEMYHIEHDKARWMSLILLTIQEISKTAVKTETDVTVK